MGGDCSAAAQSTVNIYGRETVSYCGIISSEDQTTTNCANNR
jgi:hypothetical protein